MSFFGVYSLIGLIVPVLFSVALIIGLRGAGRLGRGGAWWTMTIGAGLVIIPGALLLIGGVLGLPLGGWTFGGSPVVAQYIGASVAIAPFVGACVFLIGFAMHGLKLARTAERIQDLEQLTGAMTEEINRWGKGGRL